MHLMHDATSVRLHSDLSNSKFSARLLVQLTADHQRHYVLLARGKRAVPLPKHLEARLLVDNRATAFKCASDGAQEHLGGVRLGEELNGSGLHRLNRRWDVAVPRNEDDRRPGVIGGDALLQIQAAE